MCKAATCNKAASAQARLIVPLPAPVRAAAPLEAQTASAAGTYLAVPVQPAAVLSAAAPAVTADRARAPAASEDHRACDPAVVEDELEEEAGAGGKAKRK
jgi:H+/gluconate symporter-like permease